MQVAGIGKKVYVKNSSDEIRQKKDEFQKIFLECENLLLGVLWFMHF